MSLEAYWFSSYVWDFVSYLIPMTFAIVLFKIAGVSSLFDNGAVKALVLLFLLFGLSMVKTNCYHRFKRCSRWLLSLTLFHGFGLLTPLIDLHITFTGTYALGRIVESGNEDDDVLVV